MRMTKKKEAYYIFRYNITLELNITTFHILQVADLLYIGKTAD